MRIAYTDTYIEITSNIIFGSKFKMQKSMIPMGCVYKRGMYFSHTFVVCRIKYIFKKKNKKLRNKEIN